VTADGHADPIEPVIRQAIAEGWTLAARRLVVDEWADRQIAAALSSRNPREVQQELLEQITRDRAELEHRLHVS
jgi:hypothetical protein